MTDPTGPGPGRAPSARPTGRPPNEVMAVTVLFGLLLGLWTVAVPAFRAPDEPAHLDLVLHLAEGADYPEFDERFFGRAVGLSRDRHLIELSRPWPRFAADDAPARTDRPDVDDLGGTEPDPGARRSTDRRPLPAGAPYVYNQMPQHPPLYHQAMATVLRVERTVLPGPRPPLDRELALLRLVNALLLCPLPYLAWRATALMGAGRRAAIAASVLPLGLPQLSHIGASLNNDNLLTLFAGILAVLLAAVARGHHRSRTDLAVGVVVGLAMLTKAFALVLIPWVVAAYALAWAVGPAHRRAAALELVRAGVVTVVVGAWWWVGNLITHGEPAPTSESLTRTTARRPEGFDPDALSYAVRFVSRLASRSWAWVGFGTPKVELPGVLVGILTVLALAAVVTAVVARGDDDASNAPRRSALLVGLVPIVVLVAAVARRAWGLYVTTGTFAFVQGRYLFAGLVPVFSLVAIGACRVAGRRLPLVLLALVVALQVWTLRLVVQASWAGPGLAGELDAMLAWSPWPEAVVIAAAAAAVVAAAVTARAVHRGANPPRAL